MTLNELYTYIDTKYPRSLSCEWDNDGMMCVPDKNATVTRVLCALDVTDAVIEEAIAEGYDCILSHHPMLFRPLNAVTEDDPTAARVIRLIKHQIPVLSFHTRYDAGQDGVNDVLCGKLGLVPTGTFGENGETLGRIAAYSAPMPLASFAKQVKGALGSPVLHCVSAKKDVKNVAILGGSGKSDWHAALDAGADTYLTGEMSYSAFLDAKAAGLNVIAAGHFYTEHPAMIALARHLGETFPDVTVTVSDARNEVLTI